MTRRPGLAPLILAAALTLSEPGSNEDMHRWVARHDELRLCPVPSALFTIEFGAASLGHANDLLRQSAPAGTAPLKANPGGRLGYEATGSQDLVHAADVLLRNRGGSVYVNRDQ